MRRVARWPGWKPQNGDCTNVAANEDCRIRGPGHRQSVDQFPSTKAASTYYGQAKAKYAKCKDFTESVPASSVPGSGKMETTLMTMSKTKVGKYPAFQLTQAVTFSDSPGFSLDLNTLVTVKGTDVFTVVDLSGTNDPVSASLMLKFINRVAKLR
jgi:hypothetical protein